MSRLLIALTALLLTLSVRATTTDSLQFTSLQQEDQYRAITASLRCPKCQNNSIADSNAMIAADMRLKVYELMQQGKSRQQIVDYMVARYGHFVTYDPPLTPATLILWAGPALFVLLGCGVILLRNRRARETTELNDDEQQRLAAILERNGKP
ncbi:MULTISPECIES: cytochrome c-type biogenesis protein [Pantoea]|uniref:cytochrome c-type biogenesis protein n=1 Tax=Pantoea TaxID=53335 RepID=UPI000A220256|nr:MULTISPECIES: cytochrome c-type biogenesis protein [Pantoea]KAA6050628.1 cytochrome c-type biogenesis protein CcmH [Pantoea sp. Bo_7]KAA6094981.1 cytochrome c-type biogenesis protein CcmH [Pantoea sp. Bo_10]ORM76396.1 cytochrome C [Pantoea eucrina]RBO13282.1 cytochrome c-type biogenesis protein CcmH [Pantoea sp. 3_1284]